MKTFLLRRPILVSAIALSGLYLVLGAWRLSPYGTGFEGSDSYSRIASFIAANGSFPTSFRPPLYPLFLAGLMSVFGDAWQIAAVALQGVVSVGLGVLLVASALKLSGSPVTAFFALGLYVSNILFQFEVMAKRETVLFTLFLVFFLTAYLFISDLRKRYVSMAVAAAVALLLRPNAITLIPVFLISAWLDRKHKDFSASALILPAIIFMLLLLPWQLYVFKQTGSFPVTSSTNSGQTLWKGNNPYLLNVWPKADIDLVEGVMSDGLGGADINTPDSDAKLKAQAKTFILANLGESAKNAVIKAALFFSPVPIPMGSGKFQLNQGVPELNAYRYRSKVILGFSTLQTLLLIVGSIGFVCAQGGSEERRKFIWFSIALTLFLLAIHTLTYPESRYRWPLDIFLIIPAADYFGRKIGEKRARLN